MERATLDAGQDKNHGRVRTGVRNNRCLLTILPQKSRCSQIKMSKSEAYIAEAKKRGLPMGGARAEKLENIGQVVMKGRKLRRNL